METKVGLWIDHRKAVIVAITDKGEDIGLIMKKDLLEKRRSLVNIRVNIVDEGKNITFKGTFTWFVAKAKSLLQL